MQEIRNDSEEGHQQHEHLWQQDYELVSEEVVLTLEFIQQDLMLRSQELTVIFRKYLKPADEYRIDWELVLHY